MNNSRRPHAHHHRQLLMTTSRRGAARSPLIGSRPPPITVWLTMVAFKACTGRPARTRCTTWYRSRAVSTYWISLSEASSNTNSSRTSRCHLEQLQSRQAMETSTWSAACTSMRASNSRRSKTASRSTLISTSLSRLRCNRQGSTRPLPLSTSASCLRLAEKSASTTGQSVAKSSTSRGRAGSRSLPCPTSA